MKPYFRNFVQNFSQISHNPDGNISEFSEKLKFYKKSINKMTAKSPSKYPRPPLSPHSNVDRYYQML